MRITPKRLATLATALTALLATGLAQAAAVNFTITGSIGMPGGGLTTASVITATGSFDDAPLDGSGNGVVYFNNGGGNTLTIDLGGLYTLTQANDSRFFSGNGAFFVFDDAATTATLGGAWEFKSFDYLAFAGTNSAPIGLGSYLLAFDDFVTGYQGTWDSATFTPAPVPVPAAMWLFGSGLIGLAGLARRKSPPA